jgi:hypothetical protein
MSLLEVLVNNLDVIATKNNDKFVYTLQIEKTKKGFNYIFKCEEDTDGNTLALGFGSTLDEAIANANDDYQGLLESNGAYKDA